MPSVHRSSTCLFSPPAPSAFLGEKLSFYVQSSAWPPGGAAAQEDQSPRSWLPIGIGDTVRVANQGSQGSWLLLVQCRPSAKQWRVRTRVGGSLDRLTPAGSITVYSWGAHLATISISSYTNITLYKCSISALQLSIRNTHF